MFDFLNPQIIIQTLGLIGVFAIIFAESGLFFGFFLPGDSLLFTAGVAAATGLFNFWILFCGVIVAAILGDSVGYAFGHRLGFKIFARPDSRFFKQKYLDQTRKFFAAHGKKTIILARFIPIVRTFTPILAGVGAMRYRQFVAYNIIGGVIWGGGLSLFGYFFGQLIPNPDRYLLLAVIVIIIISFIPIWRHALSRYNKKDKCSPHQPQ
ncbi:MAG: VTT domain-containing protein [Patescibacteria group bacterium]